MSLHVKLPHLADGGRGVHARGGHEDNMTAMVLGDREAPRGTGSHELKAPFPW